MGSWLHFVGFCDFNISTIGVRTTHSQDTLQCDRGGFKGFSDCLLLAWFGLWCLQDHGRLAFWHGSRVTIRSQYRSTSKLWVRLFGCHGGRRFESGS